MSWRPRVRLCKHGIRNDLPGYVPECCARELEAALRGIVDEAEVPAQPGRPQRVHPALPD